MTNLDVNTDDLDEEVVGDSSSPQEIEGLKKALSAERQRKNSLKSELAELKAKVDELSKKPAKEYTRAELSALVDDGRLSQGEADRIYDEQTERKIEERITKKVETNVSEKEIASRINAEIDRYTDVYPDILVDGSENRKMVAEEYRRQLGLGKPDSAQTELDVLAAVFGPSTRLQKGREKERETHQETGSDSGEDTGNRETKAPKLSPERKAYYTKMIDKGFYKGWDDPTLKSELEYIRQ